MGQQSWLKNMVEAWPSLPFAALGFILAWNMLSFTGAVWVSTQDLDAVYRSQLYIIVTTSFALTLLALAICPKNLDSFLRSARCAILGGVISSMGSAIIILVGPFFFGDALESAGLNLALYCIGCALAGAGNALIMGKNAEAYGQLLPRNTIVESARSLIVAVLLYFLALGFPSWRFSTGDGPLIMGTGAFITLPLFAGFLASLYKYSPEMHYHAESPSTDEKLPSPFWRMVLVASFLSFVASLVAAYADSTTPLAESSAFASFAVIAQIPAAALFVLFASTYSEKRNFGRIFSMILVILTLAIVLATSVGSVFSPFYQVLPFAVYLFDFCFRCILLFIIFQRSASPWKIFGFGMGVFLIGDALGWLVGSYLLVQLSSTAILVISSVLAFIGLALAFLLFSGKDFDELFENALNGHATLSTLFERRLQSGVSPETGRGKFKVAIDIIADDYALSRREKDALRHLAMGHDATRIAEELGISWNTVRTHMRNLYNKLDVHSKQELIALVDSYRNG